MSARTNFDNYRGRGYIVDDVAGCLISYELSISRDLKFSAINRIMSKGGAAGGDWLWEIEHLPETVGKGRFRIWIADDSHEPFLEWSELVDADVLVSALVKQLDKLAVGQERRAACLKSFIEERYQHL